MRFKQTFFLLCVMLLLSTRLVAQDIEVKGIPNRGTHIIKLEDRGENLNPLSNNELLDIFKDKNFEKIYSGLNHKSSICIKLRKAAQILGDRYINKSFSPTDSDKKLIENIVLRYIDMHDSKGDDATESRLQIERLWHLAVPSLLKVIESKNYLKAMYAGQLLIDMRNEEIIRSVIKKLKQAKDTITIERCTFILSHMKSSCYLHISNRPCFSDEESKDWYSNIILPAISNSKK